MVVLKQIVIDFRHTDLQETTIEKTSFCYFYSSRVGLDFSLRRIRIRGPSAEWVLEISEQLTF